MKFSQDPIQQGEGMIFHQVFSRYCEFALFRGMRATQSGFSPRRQMSSVESSVKL